jgi:hypothetical protein
MKDKTSRKTTSIQSFGLLKISQEQVTRHRFIQRIQFSWKPVTLKERIKYPIVH